MSLEEYKTISELFDNDIFEIISPKNCVNARKTIGAPSEEAVLVQIKELKKIVQNNGK